MSVGRLLLATVLIAFVWPCNVKAQSNASSQASIQEEVLKVEAERDEAMQKADMALLNRIET